MEKRERESRPINLWNSPAHIDIERIKLTITLMQERKEALGEQILSFEKHLKQLEFIYFCRTGKYP